MSETNKVKENLKTYKAKCHCGKFEFEFDHKPIEESEVLRCNCSICHSRGYLFVYVLPSPSPLSTPHIMTSF